MREKPDIDALATRGDREIAVMMWNYHDDDVAGARIAPWTLTICGIPATAKRVLVRHYRIDQEHSNAYTAWKQMGSPQNPTPEQYAQLEAAGQLQIARIAEWVWPDGGRSPEFRTAAASRFAGAVELVARTGCCGSNWRV